MKDKISVILNVYNRPHTLEQQISAINRQSIPIKPENIHVWYNKSDTKQFLPKNPLIKTYISNWNTKFFGRFTIPLLIRTPYVALFDDDTLPGKNWFKNCLDSMDKQEGIYGGSGVILNDKKYNPGGKVGWNGMHSTKISRVDLVGHAWFFKQEWAKYLWMEKPFTWDNGEDIMFSFLSQKYGGINTYVPPHPETDRSMWSSDEYFGNREGNANASFQNTNHYTDRDKICIHCIDNGWKTVKNVI